MQITLIQPSRGRPEQAKSAFDAWQKLAKNAHRIKHVLSIDSDDERKLDYWRLFSPEQSIIVEQNNATMVDALNACLVHVNGGPVLTLFDDMLPSRHYDADITRRYAPGRLLSLDCGVPLQTVCCGCPTVFKRWGYIYYPAYLSMYADNDYQEHGESEGLFTTCPVKIKHQHYTTGEAQVDATYERQNHSAAYDHGQRILAARRHRNFAW